MLALFGVLELLAEESISPEGSDELLVLARLLLEYIEDELARESSVERLSEPHALKASKILDIERVLMVLFISFPLSFLWIIRVRKLKANE